VHRKKLNVVEDKVVRVLFGIIIVFKDYEVVVVVMKLAQGEPWAQRMDYPEIEFMERLSYSFGTFHIGRAEHGRPYSLIDHVYFTTVIRYRVKCGLKGLGLILTMAVGFSGGGFPADFIGRFALWAVNLEPHAFGYFFFGYFEFSLAFLALNSHFRSPCSTFKTEIQVFIPGAALLGYKSESERNGIQATKFCNFQATQ